jgi:hypothetical protein
MLNLGTSGGHAEFLEVLEYFHGLDPTLIHARGGVEGFTPFHLVSLHYAERLGSFLHTHGADINAASAKGHTPLDLLHFHDDGDRGVDEHLTVDYRSGKPQTGVAICDFAMAGPVYWKLEAKLSTKLKELYGTWGAKRGSEIRKRQFVPPKPPPTIARRSRNVEDDEVSDLISQLVLRADPFGLRRADPMADFWSGGITEYYEGSDGKEHVRHFKG